MSSIQRPVLLILAGLLGWAAWLPGSVLSQGPAEPFEGRVVSVSDDQLDVTLEPSAPQPRSDEVGVIKRDGAAVGVAMVVWVDAGRAKLRVLSRSGNAQVMPGDSVAFERETGPAGPPPDRALPRALPPGFRPLLGPAVVLPKAGTPAERRNVFHGMARGWQLYQAADRRDSWHSSTRLDSHGSMEKLFGSAWAFAWSGGASYRDGRPFSSSDDFRRVKPRFHRLSLTRKAEGSLLRLGRFFPAELPGLGYLDGAQGELRVFPGLRLGAALGARPDRLNNNLSGAERLAAAYGTFEKGSPRGFYYAGTLGVLGTSYRGRADELAFLFQQRADLGSRLGLTGSGQVDLDAGGGRLGRGPRLTRLNTVVESLLTEGLSLRAGADRYEPLDVAAERALSGGSTDYLANNYWRYWLGGSQTLPWGLSVDEELSFTESMRTFAPGLWRVGLTRRGLAGLSDATLRVTGYNLHNPLGPDYGGTAAVFLPFFGGRLALDANTSLRHGPNSSGGRGLRFVDASAHLRWAVTAAWSADLGASRSFVGEGGSSAVNSGLAYRW
ncbi:MAG: hypothetical protein WC943_07365 [Elusimicrobiota bacterium]|jgi:hypothetical protein